MKIYLASSYARKQEMRAAADLLRHHGHRVTASWIDSQQPEQPYPGQDGGMMLAYEAMKDLLDLAEAHCVVSFTEAPGSPYTRGGRHVEFGVALARGKRLYVVGPREHIFHYLHEVVCCDSLAEVVEHLRGVEAQRNENQSEEQ